MNFLNQKEQDKPNVDVKVQRKKKMKYEEVQM